MWDDPKAIPYRFVVEHSSGRYSEHRNPRSKLAIVWGLSHLCRPLMRLLPRHLGNNGPLLTGGILTAVTLNVITIIRLCGSARVMTYTTGLISKECV